MLHVVCNIKCTSEHPYNQQTVNQALYNMSLELPNFDFHIYDEERYYGDVSGINAYDASMVYPRIMNPVVIGWRVLADSIVHNPHISSYTPISELHFVLNELLAPRNIFANGYVILINESLPEVHYYKIANNNIYRHTNKSMDGTDFYIGIEKMRTDINNINPELERHLNYVFTPGNLEVNIRENSTIEIFKAIAHRI
jgi:hypothetical protein